MLAEVPPLLLDWAQLVVNLEVFQFLPVIQAPLIHAEVQVLLGGGPRAGLRVDPIPRIAALEVVVVEGIVAPPNLVQRWTFADPNPTARLGNPVHRILASDMLPDFIGGFLLLCFVSVLVEALQFPLLHSLPPLFLPIFQPDLFVL